mgnify:CR=1 FL=1
MIQPEQKGSVAEIETMATDWLARLDAAGLVHEQVTPEELVQNHGEFGEWLMADIGHRIAFLQALGVWKRTGRLMVLRTEPAHAELKTQSGLRRSAVWAAMGSAAAVMLLAFTLLPVLGLVPSNEPSETDIYFSQLGQTRTIELADGTQVTLNTNSRIDVAFQDDVRLVTLVRGEALFDVAKDASRPFRVDTPTGDIEVLGTVFAVELRSQSAEIAVMEGVVALTPETGDTSRTQKMTVGMIGYADNENVITETAGLSEIEDRLLWRSGRIRFRNMPLVQVAREFNRYSDIELMVQDETVADLRIGGTFAVDNVDGFLRLAETGLGLRADRQGKQIRISAE